MLKARIEQSGETGTLVLEGELIIDHADELKRILLEAFGHGASLDINIQGVNNVDFFGIQVICSAHDFALKSGKELTLTGEQPEAFRDALALAGYDHNDTCFAERTCPWNAR